MNYDIGWYDIDGNRVSAEAGTALLSEIESRRVGLDEFMTDGGPLMISTVHIVLDHQHGDGPPLIFETMVFWDGDEVDSARWSTLDEARAGHVAIVAKFREKLPAS